ncbi:hypothetical protein DFH08DRAFT_971437 [Mycena albidolilacea]|uniref:Uncharacterized protein n=1 Tax=Mycena albidolilacea TaxID=1033008 RepID=A0AAD6ZE11_9AGAR|nr:hypothetical protein DFH08DRAFT_971437 [Mycena albidolilacea]
MVRQTSSQGAKLHKHSKAESPSKGNHTKTLSAATMAARRQASARYRERERVLEDPALAADFRARSCEASCKFRAKNTAGLAHRQRIIRLEAYSRNHGHHAWLKHQNLLEERHAEAQEYADVHPRAHDANDKEVEKDGVEEDGDAGNVSLAL